MRRFAETADAIRATSKKNEKVALLASYFDILQPEPAAIAAIFFSGRPFAAFEERTLQVGGNLLWRVVAELSGASDQELNSAYRRFGDLGDAAELALAERNRNRASELTLAELAKAFHELAAARGPAAKAGIARSLLQRASPTEAKYIIKIMLGDLRIGLRESLVEEAIAKAFNHPLSEVQRANMMLGDIGQTLRLASENRLDEARMRLFHPIGFMLASPVASAAEALQCFAEGAAHISVEDKYDGIRAQAHIGMHDGTRGVRIFSRTLDDITASFPELAAPLSRLPGELVLDGEIVAWQSGGHDKAGHALAFSRLQQRLGRKKVTAAMQREVPLAYVIFDVLYANGELIIDRPLRERGALLDEIFANAADTEYVATTGPQAELQLEPAIDDAKTQAPEIIRAPTAKISSAADLDRLFEIARQRGNEGLMIKDLQSAYTPGRRGGAWLKLKRELATLDVVVTIAEYGHGKRAGVLSDYTFAVRDELDPKRLLNVGKAYSGLTDREIQELTQFFLEHTLVDEGFRRIVEPVVVLEVAFNNMMRSDRHESGYALRFPRIVRIRTDKLPGDIDTLATVREIYERQQLPKKP